MPHYVYVCSSCEEQQEIFHSIEEVVGDCSLCGGVDTMNKVPSFRISSKFESKVGETVKEFIKTAKRELEDEKQKSRERPQ